MFPASIAVVPATGDPRNETVTLLVDATVAPVNASDQPSSFRRIARFQIRAADEHDRADLSELALWRDGGRLCERTRVPVHGVDSVRRPRAHVRQRRKLHLRQMLTPLPAGSFEGGFDVASMDARADANPIDAARGCSAAQTRCAMPCADAGADSGACGVCVDTASDRQNCGACGRVCPAAEICVAGFCACIGGGTLCSGAVCVNTRTDSTHCGGCATVCTNGRKSARTERARVPPGKLFAARERRRRVPTCKTDPDELRNVWHGLREHGSHGVRSGRVRGPLCSANTTCGACAQAMTLVDNGTCGWCSATSRCEERDEPGIGRFELLRRSVELAQRRVHGLVRARVSVPVLPADAERRRLLARDRVRNLCGELRRGVFVRGQARVRAQTRARVGLRHGPGGSIPSQDPCFANTYVRHGVHGGVDLRLVQKKQKRVRVRDGDGPQQR